MRRARLALVFLFALDPSLRADDTIPAKTLEDLKAATVFIKVEAGRISQTGTGFVLKVDDDTALIVTNEHVVTVPRPFPPATRIEVVFQSGRAKLEKTVRAEVLATDAGRDLAVLRVKGVKDFATAIDFSKKTIATETTTIFALGFPFGKALSTGQGNPAVTIGKGTVSSLREDDNGELAVIQIDGDLNPGNSGGPVVDSQGRLVGIAVAKITGTRIGLAIPPGELSKMLDGRLARLSTRVVKVEDGTAEVEVTVGFIDPLGKVSKASVRILRKTPGEPDPSGKPKDRKPIPGAEEFALKVDPGTQQAVARIPLKNADKGIVDFWVQPIYTNGAKPDLLVSSGSMRVDFSGKVAVGPKGPNSLGPKGQTPTPSGPAPEPKLSGGVAAASADTGDLKVTKLTIGTGAGPGCMCWTTDGKGFYHLDGKGTIRLIGFPEAKELAALETGKKCDWISLSAAGLVVTVSDAQEAWVLDAKTLKVGARMPIAKAKRVVSSPQLVHAFAAESDFGRGTVTVLDLKAGKLAKQFEVSSLAAKGFIGFDNPTFSPDGKFLFAEGLEQVFRFAVDGATLKFEETGPRIIQGAHTGLSVGPDYVAAPSGGGNYGIGDMKRTSYSTYLFTHDNLKTPALTLSSGAYPSAVGFDKSAGLFYAQNAKSQLIVFDKDANKLKEYDLTGGRFKQVRQFLVHPDGRKLLVHVEETIYAVEVPKF